ncbi:MAG: squalene synthase HpnC, partial [Planctomycetota bacterium]
MTSPFERDLQAYGPDAAYPTPTAAEALAFCRRFARAHYENFTVASLLLPRHLVPHFHVLYSY